MTSRWRQSFETQVSLFLFFCFALQLCNNNLFVKNYCFYLKQIAKKICLHKYYNYCDVSESILLNKTIKTDECNVYASTQAFYFKFSMTCHDVTLLRKEEWFRFIIKRFFCVTIQKLSWSRFLRRRRLTALAQSARCRFLHVVLLPFFKFAEAHNAQDLPIQKEQGQSVCFGYQKIPQKATRFWWST
jgi:hypothetical protein